MSSSEHELDDAFLREARIGLMVLTVLIAIFIYVAYGKLSGWYSPEPLAFQGQPEDEMSSNVGPGDYSNQGASAFNLQRSPEDASKPLRLRRQAPQRSPSVDANTPFRQPRQVKAKTPTFENNRPETTNVPGEPVAFKPRIQPPTRPQPIVERPKPEFHSTFANNKTLNRSQSGQLSAFTPNATQQTTPQSTPQTTLKAERASRSSMTFPKASTNNSLRHSNSLASDNSFSPPKLPTKTSERIQSGGGGFTPATKASSEKPRTVKPVSATETIMPPTDKSQWPAKRTPATFEENSSNVDPGAHPLDQPRTNMPSPALDNPSTATRLPKTIPGSNLNLTSQPLPDSTSPASIVTETGDSFWLVAQQVYGDGRYFDALYQYNADRVDSFNDIQPGTELHTPDVEVLRKRWPRSCPREELVTIGGETLFEIASERLGQASRYVELLKLNYDRLPKETEHNTSLPAGVTLELPRTR